MSISRLAAAGAAQLAYAVRPLALEGCDAGACGDYGRGGPLQLAGYGVELALKNMEYKAMDEKARRPETSPPTRGCALPCNAT